MSLRLDVFAEWCPRTLTPATREGARRKLRLAQERSALSLISAAEVRAANSPLRNANAGPLCSTIRVMPPGHQIYNAAGATAAARRLKPSLSTDACSNARTSCCVVGGRLQAAHVTESQSMV